MLEKLLGRLKFRKPPSSMSHEAQSEVVDSEPTFRNLGLFHDLQDIALLHKTSTKQQAKWQLPLPYDVVFAIIQDFLKDDSKAQWNLFRSCASLHQLCSPLVYQTVSIHTRSRDSPTILERFARSTAQNPRVIAQLQTLRIIDDGKMFQGCRPITPEEESLCFILTRDFPLLRRIELDLRVVWDLIPLPVQHAFHTGFALPTLRQVRFQSCRIRSDILMHLSHISRLEICAEVSRPVQLVDVGETKCSPEHLVLWDQTAAGFVTNIVFNEEICPLRLSSLQILEYRTHPFSTHLLNEPFRRCSRTLTSLTLFITGESDLPYLVDLASLRTLKTLYLSCDTKMMSLDENPRGLANFNFLVATISSSRKPSSIERVHLLIRARRFDFAKRLPWSHLDDIFKTREDWPNLRKIWVRIIDEDSTQRDDGWYKEGRIEEDIVPFLPSLATLDLVQFEMVFGRHHFLDSHFC